jgi:hypothetical protein
MSPFQMGGRFGSLAAALLGFAQLDQLYRRRRPGAFIPEALRLLEISVTTMDSVESIPERGAVVIIANHPTGAVDGLALAHLVMQRRPDVKLLANHLLERIPELRDHVIAVNAFRAQAPETTRGLRQAKGWLAAGGAIVVFPAGAVSATRIDGRAVDGEWRQWCRRSYTPRIARSSACWAGCIRCCGPLCSCANSSLAGEAVFRFPWDGPFPWPGCARSPTFVHASPIYARTRTRWAATRTVRR